MIKVFLIDDHAVVRAGLRSVLQAEKGIQVVGEANTGQAGIQQVHALTPDVVILDALLPDLPGLEVVRRLIHWNPDIKILALSSNTQDLPIFRLFEAGVWGYLSKEASSEELLQMIRGIHAGQKMITPELASHFILKKVDREQAHAFYKLSAREKEILLGIVHGLPVNTIAKNLKISHKTVHSFRSRIFRKIGVKNDRDLTLLAAHYGIVSLEELEHSVE